MKKYFLNSLMEVKNVHVLVQCAIFIALYVVVDAFSINLPMLQFTFSYLALAVIAYIAGPSTAFFCGGICEVIGYMLAPKTGPLHLGFTFTSMLTGFVMGLFLYKRDLKLWRIIVSRGIVAFVLNLGLNTYWLSDLIGKAYIPLLPARFIKTIIQYPIDIILIFIILKIVITINSKFIENKNIERPF